MKKLILYVLLCLPMVAQADLLSDLLQKKYNPVVLSERAQDSILSLGQKAEENGRYRLEYENKQILFRHSFVADYYLVDNQTGERTHLSDTMVRDAVLSPNGKYVAYAKGNNLYIYKTDFHTELAITVDENPDILNGTADWLYEEEFACTRLFEFSPDSKMLAYIRLDETAVPTFRWQEFLDANGEEVRYPGTYSLRYPKAGDENATVSVHTYDILYKGIKTMQTDAQDGYIPRLAWRDQELMLLKLNRDQNKMEVVMANPKTTICHPWYKEQSDRYYVDYALFDDWQWLNDGRVVVLSEKNGWRSLYLYQADGTCLRQLTPDGMDVTCVYGTDEATGVVYYEAAPNPMERQAYSVSLKKGAPVRLTEETGTHSLYFSVDMKRCIDCFQSVEVPNRYTLYQAKGNSLKQVRVLEDNSELLARWKALDAPKTTFTRIPTERGDTLDAYVILPKNVNDGQRHPLMVIQYSGPASQRVLNVWKKRWGTYLAEQGYIVVDADSRGTDCRGRAWRNETYMHLGQKEAEDQISVANYMARLPYVDKDRMVMCGWSYGGFQTIRTMSDTNSPFRCGIAIAPVTDWGLYDSAYTERYMRRPQVNEDGYKGTSLRTMANELKGKLLIVHGLADDNVHAQNTLLYIDALVKAGKQFEMQIYPDDNHFLRKRANYEHLHRRIMLFLEQNND